MRLFFLLFFFSLPVCAQTVIVPQGKPIMLDGKLSPGEWTDSKPLALGTFARLYCKQNNREVLIAIELLESKTGTADLYLSADGQIYDLHASAKLGEKTMEGGHWPEEWEWWNNDRWVASVSRPDDFANRKFRDEKVREYQIARSRFPGSTWKIFLELMTPAEPTWKTTALPESGNKNSDKNWITLQLD